MGFSERLSALDSSFLTIEHDGSHMHIAALIVLEKGPLGLDHGGVDFDKICEHAEAALEQVPRYRQRVVKTPVLGQPQWVDDDHFNIRYHLRHAALPRPGDERQLKRLAGRIFSQTLDRSRPLWELWVVEGLDDERFALILKAHHCLVDGVGGAELLVALLSSRGGESDWEPRPAAQPHELVEQELKHRWQGLRRVGDMVRGALEKRQHLVEDAAQIAHESSEFVKAGLTPCSDSVFNTKQVSPHRRYDVCELDIGEMKAVKKKLGGKLNDVVLATAAGAFKRYLERRGIDPASYEDFRAMLPVNLRKDDSSTGNRVGMAFVNLPIAEADPAARYAAVVEATQHVKGSAAHAKTTETVEELSDILAPSLVGSLMELSGQLRTMNVVITNVPGPPFELQLLGARIEQVFPLVPLFRNQGLGIALLSYNGKMFWGLNADWNVVPDLHLLTEDIRASFEELKRAAASASLE